jgi:hypothetical protein
LKRRCQPELLSLWSKSWFPPTLAN